jgi:hypothetical protein
VKRQNETSDADSQYQKQHHRRRREHREDVRERRRTILAAAARRCRSAPCRSRSGSWQRRTDDGGVSECWERRRYLPVAAP